MFNVFLPKLLESTGTTSIADSLWDVLVFTLGGCPGALVRCFLPLLCPVFFDTYSLSQLGARLILTPLGRRWSLAGSTLFTAGFCILFVFAQSAQSAWAVRISAVGVGLASTVRLLLPSPLPFCTTLISSHVGPQTMWAVLYGCVFCPCFRSSSATDWDPRLRWTPEIFATKGTIPFASSACFTFTHLPALQCEARRVELRQRYRECVSSLPTLYRPH